MKVSGSLLAMLSMLAFLLASACDDGGQSATTPTSTATTAPTEGPTAAPTPTPTLSAPATGKIAFVSHSDGEFGIFGTTYSSVEIDVINADGSEQIRLTHTETPEEDPVWSPDGTRIAFTRHDKIYTMNADGSDETQLTGRSEHAPVYAIDWSPAWSPDGERITFAAAQREQDMLHRKYHHIYVMNADGTGVTRLTGDDPAMDLWPAWSPDGARITFISNRGDRWAIYVMNADGSGQTHLITGGLGFHVWSPDGSRIAFLSGNGSQEIYVMKDDGSGQTKLTDNLAIDGDPAWSPDGSRIAFRSLRDGNAEIYVMNADGSGQTNLTNNPAVDFLPAWSPSQEN